MRLLKRAIDRDNCGTVYLVPEDAEDMWNIYNLIVADDSIRASTFRKVKMNSNPEELGKGGESNKVRIKLTIRVESVEFDGVAPSLRIKGKNVEKNNHVAVGQYHTHDLNINCEFSLHKDNWDSVSLDRLRLACDPCQRCDLAAVVMNWGLANICLITASTTLSRARIEQNMNQKKKGQNDKAQEKFFKAIMESILRHINFDVVKCVLLGSPGLLKNQFLDYLIQQSVKKDLKNIVNNKGKFLLVDASSGTKAALKEILVNPLVQSRLANTSAAGQVRALETFYQMSSNEPSRAVYGMEHVKKANEFQAIETLLISDSLFRCNEPLTRRQYVQLVDGVKKYTGDVIIFSSLHISGEELAKLTGVAAILRYPIDFDC